MFVMFVQCPHCNGKKEFVELISYEWDNKEEWEVTSCRTCKGLENITELQNAIFQARGSPEPIVFRGFA